MMKIHKRLLAGSAAALMALTDLSQAQTPRPGLESIANQELNLRDSVVANLNWIIASNGRIEGTVPLSQGSITLRLAPYSVRAPNYKLLVQVVDGSIVETNPGPEGTFRGRVVEWPGSKVAGGLGEDGMRATILEANGTRWIIEPIVDRVPGAARWDHVVYRAADALGSSGSCGNDIVGDDVPSLVDPHEVSKEGSLSRQTIHYTELAYDADVEYFNEVGSVSAVEQRIAELTNIVNMQYETEVGIAHLVSVIVVRTAEPDPYSSNLSDTLLCQFITEWTINQQGLSFDVAMLFTGRPISGGVIGQAATFGDICDRVGRCTPPGFLDDGAFCYSWITFDPLARTNFATNLMAHELGHLWDAQHCSCTSNTMNPVVTGSNTFTTVSRSVIQSHRNSRTCLGTSVSSVWLDFAYMGHEQGTILFPFNTMAEALELVGPGGVINASAGSSSETLTIDQSVTIQASGGAVTIGYW